MAAATMKMADMSDMAADMPCCPDKQKNECKDCPLLAICILKVLQTGPCAHAVVIGLSAGERLHPLDDAMGQGVSRPPPDHPPRSQA